MKKVFAIIAVISIVASVLVGCNKADDAAGAGTSAASTTK